MNEDHIGQYGRILTIHGRDGEQVQSLLEGIGARGERSGPGRPGGRDFRVDVRDHEDEVIVVADLPGVEKEDVTVRLTDPGT